MGKAHCPGTDTLYWTAKDLFEVPCNHCEKPVEFFKDDLRRRCPHCGEFTVNPKNDMACAAWCKHAKECLAQLGIPFPADTPEEAAK
ncbi:MAG: hypothetical protein ACYDBB_14395 [Armatimonadota bacterium]